MKIYGRAPARIDLAGGTLDIWPIWLFHPGAVTVNVAIDLRAEVFLQTGPFRGIRIRSEDTGRRISFSSLDTIRHNHSLPLVTRLISFFAPKPGFDLVTRSGVPAGAGLAGSSALNIALCGVLNRLTGSRYSKKELLTIAQNVEAQILGIPTGIQDYYPALYGGVNAIWLTETGGRREPLDFPARELESRILLCYSGNSRNSGKVNWEVMKRHLDGDPKIRNGFDVIARSAAGVYRALKGNNLSGIESPLEAEWRVRKALGMAVVGPGMSSLFRLGIRSGAEAGRVCGAGGGGCIFFLCGKKDSTRIRTELQKAGVEVLPFRVARTGLTVRVEK